MEWIKKYQIAENKETSLKELDSLSLEEDWRIKLAVAKNNNTSKDTLKNIIQNCNRYEVMVEILNNKNIDKDIIDSLLDFNHPIVRDIARYKYSIL